MGDITYEVLMYNDEAHVTQKLMRFKRPMRNVHYPWDTIHGILVVIISDRRSTTTLLLQGSYLPICHFVYERDRTAKVTGPRNENPISYFPFRLQELFPSKMDQTTAETTPIGT